MSFWCRPGRSHLPFSISKIKLSVESRDTVRCRGPPSLRPPPSVGSQHVWASPPRRPTRPLDHLRIFRRGWSLGQMESPARSAQPSETGSPRHLQHQWRHSQLQQTSVQTNARTVSLPIAHQMLSSSVVRRGRSCTLLRHTTQPVRLRSNGQICSTFYIRCPSYIRVHTVRPTLVRP